jgi:hypothetical protein
MANAEGRLGTDEDRFGDGPRGWFPVDCASEWWRRLRAASAGAGVGDDERQVRLRGLVRLVGSRPGIRSGGGSRQSRDDRSLWWRLT